MSRFDLYDWDLRELKSNPISEDELEKMFEFTKSYEFLFSKRSTQIKAQQINLKNLEETDFKKLILEHYSFLKRPVFLTEDRIFVGNAKHTLDDLAVYFETKE